VNDFVDSVIDFSLATTVNVANQYTAAGGFEGQLSDVWFDTSYVNLTTENPFYDVETKKPKYLGANGELPTGSSPLIYLPLRADDAGNNLGTGGDFTVNSGPYVGARGASEFLARSTTNGLTSVGTVFTNYLSNAGLTEAPSATTTLSFVFFARVTNTTTSSYEVIFSFGVSSFDLVAATLASQDLELIFNGGTKGQFVDAFSTTDWCPVFCSYDGANVYSNIKGVADTQALTDTIDLTDICAILSKTGQKDWVGEVGSFYLATDYIDFSQEANRLKFMDAFGYPVDLQPAIDAGDIPTPLIHMKFDDPDALGTNSGSGGDFTVTGTVNSGSDVKG
jgi:hypothetical protein